jgi:hypothetical protein
MTCIVPALAPLKTRISGSRRETCSCESHAEGFQQHLRDGHLNRRDIKFFEHGNECAAVPADSVRFGEQRGMGECLKPLLTLQKKVCTK